MKILSTLVLLLILYIPISSMAEPKWDCSWFNDWKFEYFTYATMAEDLSNALNKQEKVAKKYGTGEPYPHKFQKIITVYHPADPKNNQAESWSSYGCNYK